MAGLSDGLLERVLSAAIATVITFVLSWRFILEYKGIRAPRRGEVEDMDAESNIDGGMGKRALCNNNETSAFALETDIASGAGEGGRFGFCSEDVRQSCVNKGRVSPLSLNSKYPPPPLRLDSMKTVENLSKNCAVNVAASCDSNMNISHKFSGRSYDNNARQSDAVVVDLSLNDNSERGENFHQLRDTSISESNTESRGLNLMSTLTLLNSDECRYQNGSIPDAPEDERSAYSYTQQPADSSLDSELQSVTIITKDSTVNIEYRQIIEGDEYQSLLDPIPESSAEKSWTQNATAIEDSPCDEESVNVVSMAYNPRKDNVWGYQPGLQTITELPWEDMNVDWDSDVSDVDIDVDSVTGSVRLVPKGSDSEDDDDSEGEYDCDSSVQDGGDLANLELNYGGYYPRQRGKFYSSVRDKEAENAEETLEGATGPSLKSLVTNALSGVKRQTIRDQVNIDFDCDDHFTTRNERLQHRTSATEDNKITSDRISEYSFGYSTGMPDNTRNPHAKDNAKILDLNYYSLNENAVLLPVKDSSKSRSGLTGVDYFNSATTPLVSPAFNNPHKRCTENDDKLTLAADSGPDYVNTDSIACLSSEKPLTNHGDKFYPPYCKALVNSVKAPTAMTFDESKAASGVKIQNDYSPKQLVATEVLHVSRPEKTRSGTNTDAGVSVCSNPGARFSQTIKIDENVTWKQNQASGTQSQGPVCGSGREIRQGSEISFRLSSGCSITFERKWGNQNVIIENENNDPAPENKALSEQELIIDPHTGGAFQKKEKFNSVELSDKCLNESEGSKATKAAQYGSYRPLRKEQNSLDSSNAFPERNQTIPRGSVHGTVTTESVGGNYANCQLLSESPSNSNDSREYAVNKRSGDFKRQQVSQTVKRVLQPVSRSEISENTTLDLKYIDAYESGCVNDLHVIDISAVTITELSSVLSDNFSVSRVTEFNTQSQEYSDDGLNMTCDRPMDTGHSYSGSWNSAGQLGTEGPRTCQDQNMQSQAVNKQGHSKLTIKANSANKGVKMADSKGLSPGLRLKTKSRGVLYQNTRTFDLVASKLDRHCDAGETTPAIDQGLKINSRDSTDNSYNKLRRDQPGLDPRDQRSDKPLYNDTRQTTQQVSKHDSKYMGPRPEHGDINTLEHTTHSTRTTNHISNSVVNDQIRDRTADQKHGLPKGQGIHNAENIFDNGINSMDCVREGSRPERDTISVTTHNFHLPGSSPEGKVFINPLNGRNDANVGDLTHTSTDVKDNLDEKYCSVDESVRYNSPVTAIATSTAVARQEVESDPLGRPGSPLRRPVVSAVASAEASGLNPFFAVARATAHAASIASANATSGVATTRGHAIVPSDVTVVMSTSCTLNAARDQDILQDASDVSGAMIERDVMKVSARSTSTSPIGAGGSSSANGCPATTTNGLSASYMEQKSPHKDRSERYRQLNTNSLSDASAQTVRTYLPRTLSPTKRLGPTERHILKDDSFTRRIKSPEPSPTASPGRTLKANIPSWYKEMHYRPPKNDDDDGDYEILRKNKDVERSREKTRSPSPVHSHHQPNIFNTSYKVGDFSDFNVEEIAPPRPPPPKNLDPPTGPERTHYTKSIGASDMHSYSFQQRPPPPPKTYRSVLQEPVSLPASPAQQLQEVEKHDPQSNAVVHPSTLKRKVNRQLFLRGSKKGYDNSDDDLVTSRFSRESQNKEPLHVPVPKIEDMDLPGIDSSASKGRRAVDLKEKLRKARPKSLTISRNDIDQAIAEAKAKSLQRANKTKSMDNIYMCHAGPHTLPAKFFTERASTPCLLETDMDTGKETRTLLYQETDLDEVLRPINKAKSMMELSRRPNKLDKGPRDISFVDGALSNDQRSQSTYGLRVSASLQKLHVPDWYRSSPVSHQPKEGLYLKNANSSGDLLSPSPRPSVAQPAMSPQERSTRPVITARRVTPPSSAKSNKSSSPSTSSSTNDVSKFELPSAKFRQSPSELKRIENRWGSGTHLSSASPLPKSKLSPGGNPTVASKQQDGDDNQSPTYDPVINEICAKIDAITAQTQDASPPEVRQPTKPEINMQLAFEAVQRFFTPPQSPARQDIVTGTVSRESSLADLSYHTPPAERRNAEWDTLGRGGLSRSLTSNVGRSTPATLASSRPSFVMSAFGRSTGYNSPFPILQFAEPQEEEDSPRLSSTPKLLRHKDIEVAFTETNLDDSEDESVVGLTEDVFEDSLENASMEEVLNGLLSLPNGTKSPATDGGNESVTEKVQNFMTSALQESPLSSMLSLDTSATSVDLSMFSLNMSADSTQSIHYLEEEMPPEKTSTEIVDEEKVLVKCRYPQCCKVQVLNEARKSYKTCHHCYTYYCSRQCRKMHWDSHKKRCLYSRVSSLCKNVIKKINTDQDLLYHVSRVARTGYLSRGRGYVHIYFDTPDAANVLLERGMECPPELKYVSVKEVENQLENDKLSELHAFSKKYNPEYKFVVHVCVLAAKEIPVKPTPRLPGPLIQKCAKLRLSAAHIKTKPGAKEEQETLILTAVPGAHELEELGPHKAREVCFINIQRKLRQRGVSLRHMYPTVYNQVCDYVANNEEFAPILILPYDGNTGKRFMCIIMPKSDPEMDWLEAKKLMQDLDLSMDVKDNIVNTPVATSNMEANGSSSPSR